MLRRMKRLRRESRGLFFYHIMLCAFLVCLGLVKLSRGRWEHAGFCLLTLTLCAIPALSEWLLKLRVDAPLDLAGTLFAVCANILGEMLGFYVRFPWWDAALHVIWGFLAGLLGCALLEALQGTKLRPGAAVLAALGFSALAAAAWELFEFTMDAVFPWDMQKDAWLRSVHSVLLNPEGTNAVVTVTADSVIVNGVSWPGLLDPGLRDTISDLILNFAGTLPAAALLLHFLRRGRMPKLLQGLMPVPFSETEVTHEKE